MRAPTSFIATAAVAAAMFGGQPPAVARSAGDVHMEIDFNCFGCGTSTGRVRYWCYGYCEVNGNTCIGACHYYGNSTSNTPPGTCPTTGTVSGSIAFPSGTQSFNLTWVANTWVMTFGDGSTGGGTWAVTDPIGNPCGGPATGTFVGAMAGA